MPAYAFTYVNGEPVATQGPYVPSIDHSPASTAVSDLPDAVDDEPAQAPFQVHINGLPAESLRPGAVLQGIIDEFSRRAAEEAGSPPPGFEWGTRVDIATAQQAENEHPSLSSIIDDERDPNDIPGWDFDGENIATDPKRRRGWINKIDNITHDRQALRELLDSTDDTVTGALFANTLEKGRLVSQAFDETGRDARSLLELSQHLVGQARDLTRRCDRLADQFDNYRTTVLAYTATDQCAQEAIGKIWIKHFGNVNVDHLEPGELLRGVRDDQRIRNPRHPPPARYRTRFPRRSNTASPDPVLIPGPSQTETSTSAEVEEQYVSANASPPSGRTSPTPFSFRRAEPYPQRRRPGSPIRRTTLDSAFPGNSRVNPATID